MASAYKSVGKQRTDDVSDFEDTDLSDPDESSSTVQAESSKITTHHAKSSLPLELKNRVLMLTTRGVSHRYVKVSDDHSHIDCLQTSTSPQ